MVLQMTMRMVTRMGRMWWHEYEKCANVLIRSSKTAWRFTRERDMILEISNLVSDLDFQSPMDDILNDFPLQMTSGIPIPTERL